MNGKQYIGKRVSSFERLTDSQSYTGVAVVVDDEHEYLAGDQSGNVLEVECPYGTQAMANNILASIRGNFFHGYQAADAALDPAAELGDGVTVNGIYSVLAKRTLDFGPGAFSDISAPVDTELEHEFKYKSQQQRKTDRKIAETRSLIEKSSEEIRLAVEATDGRLNELRIAFDGVTISDESGTTRIKGSSIETGSIAAGSIRADQINLTGAITFGDLDIDVQDAIEDRGVSEARVHTLITQDLVASPTIAGGIFRDLDDTSWIEITKDPSEYFANWASLNFFNKTFSGSTPVFSVHNADGFSASLHMKGTTVFQISYGSVYPQNTWDFSNANVIGLPDQVAVFG